MEGSRISLSTNRGVLAVVAVLLIGAAILVAIFGVKESKPDTPPPKAEVRAPARVVPVELPPIRIRQLSSGDAVISLNSDVFFAFDSADLTEDAHADLRREVLPRVLAALNRRRARVDLSGYTDGVGDDAYNLRLSQERADAVRDFLVAAGVPSGSLDAEGFGEKLATSSRPDPDVRRVDVVLRKGGVQ
jgi:outer membrane protein OmpA-like peptidoglycan-associated protein